MLKRIFSYFLQGMLIVAPLALTIYIVISVFTTIDGWVSINSEKVFGFNVPGAGVLVIFILVTILGALGELTVVKPVKAAFKRLILRIPLLNLLYSSLNDLFSAFVGKEKKFNVPVKVLFNKENDLWKMGFITKEEMNEIDEPNLAAVYFPHSYNFSGELYLIPTDRIQELTISSTQAMKFIVSGGVTNIDQIPESE